MLLFPRCFWGDRDMFGHVSPDPARRGAYYLFYGYERISGGSVLAALAAGAAAEELEGKTDAEAVGEVMAVLRGVFGPRGVDVPAPLQVGGGVGPEGGGGRVKARRGGGREGGQGRPSPPAGAGLSSRRQAVAEAGEPMERGGLGPPSHRAGSARAAL